MKKLSLIVALVGMISTATFAQQASKPAKAEPTPRTEPAAKPVTQPPSSIQSEPTAKPVTKVAPVENSKPVENAPAGNKVTQRNGRPQNNTIKSTMVKQNPTQKIASEPSTKQNK